MGIDMSPMDKPSADGRERWSSRMAFVVAAIGSAIGIGNVWRFPALCFEYGGGAFFIPYLLSLFLLGIPLLILEIGLGQSFQGGDAVVFGKMNPRLRAIGLASVWGSFMWVGYFCVMVAWFVRMLFYSFFPELPWQKNEYKYNSGGAFTWAQENVMESSWEKDAVPTKVAWFNILCFLFVWLSVWISLVFGIRTTGRMTYFTMGLPVIVILILVGRGVTLENAGYGLMEYIGRWDLSLLASNPTIWTVACTQIFVSIGVTYGVMTAYASYNSTKENVNSNSWIVAIANSAFSITGGFAVFSSLGYMCFFQSEEFLRGAKMSVPTSELTYDAVLMNTTRNVSAFPYNGFGLEFWEKTEDTDDINCPRIFNQEKYHDWFADIVSGCRGKSSSACSKDASCSVVGSKCTAHRCSHPKELTCTSDEACEWKSGSCEPNRRCANNAICDKLPLCHLKNGACTEHVIDTWEMHGVPLIPLQNLEVKGPGLVLGSYPVVFGTMPLPHLWSCLFFFIMLLLGTNSAFSFVEGVVTVLLDTKAFHRYRRTTIVTLVCFIGSCISICYAHDAGYNAIQTTDFYIGMVMLFIGIFETAASCWIYRWEDTAAVCGKLPTLLLFLSVFFSAVLSATVCFVFDQFLIGLLVGVLTSGALIGAALYFLKSSGDLQFAYADRASELFLGNIEYLRYRFNRGCLDDVAAAKWYLRVPFMWSILIKFFVPPVIIFLTFNIICNEQFGAYANLAAGYQAIGMVIAFTGVVLVFTGLIFPGLFSWLEYQSTNDDPEYMIEYYDTRRNRMLANANCVLSTTTESMDFDHAMKDVALPC